MWKAKQRYGFPVRDQGDVSEGEDGLLQTETIPAFAANQYGEGLFNTIQGVVKRLREVDAGVATRPPLRKWEKISNVLGLSIYSLAFVLPLVIQPYAEWYENRHLWGQTPSVKSTVDEIGSLQLGSVLLSTLSRAPMVDEYSR